MAEELEIEPLSLFEETAATYAFARCRLPSQPYAECLIVSFEGDADSQDRGFSYAFMNGMIAAGVGLWRPSAVVLDLSKYAYTWGDEMAQLLVRVPEPVAVVVSDLNRVGMTSLIEDELGGDQKAADWLFDTLAGAVAACDRQYARLVEAEREEWRKIREADEKREPNTPPRRE